MTTKQIEVEQMKVNAKYEIAKQIRKLLDDARKTYGTQEWDDGDLEHQIIELVCEEG